MKYFIFCMVFLLGFGGMAQGAEPETTIDITSVSVLDLQTAAQIALSKNPSIHGAMARVDMARERYRQARSSYWPRLDITGSYARVDLSDKDNDSNLAFNPDFNNPEDHYQAELRLTWLVFDGFARRNTARSARYGRDMSQESLDDVRRLLLSAVANGYYTAQLARETIRIAKADKAFYKKQLDETTSRHEAGAGALSDVLNFEVRYNASRVTLVQAEKSYEASLYSLAALMGVPEGVLPDTLVLKDLESEKAKEMASVDVSAQIDYAMGHRPDMQLTAYAVKSALSGVKTARSDYYPMVSLVGAIAGDRISDPGFEGEDFGNTVSLQLSYNLFSGGLTRSKIGEAKAAHREVVHEQNNLTLSISRQIRESITRISSAQEQLTIQRLNTRLVQQNRDLVEQEYAAGQGSLVRLNEAQRDLTTAQSRLAQALVSLRQNLIKLDTDTGYILERF